MTNVARYCSGKPDHIITQLHDPHCPSGIIQWELCLNPKPGWCRARSTNNPSHPHGQGPFSKTPSDNPEYKFQLQSAVSCSLGRKRSGANLQNDPPERWGF
jgi:hypothetical protein